MIRTINVRGLKDRLSACLREVQGGDVLLVTDRGRVVAELRKPTVGAHTAGGLQDAKEALVESGALRIGLPNAGDAYEDSDVSLSTAVLDEALAFTRGDR